MNRQLVGWTLIAIVGTAFFCAGGLLVPKLNDTWAALDIPPQGIRYSREFTA